jgi:hypothetical protein
MPMLAGHEDAPYVFQIRRACWKVKFDSQFKTRKGLSRQALISLGDERLGRAMVRLERGRTSWKRALKDEGIDPDMIYHERGITEELPWERVLGSDDREALLARYRAVTG